MGLSTDRARRDNLFYALKVCFRPISPADCLLSQLISEWAFCYKQVWHKMADSSEFQAIVLISMQKQNVPKDQMKHVPRLCIYLETFMDYYTAGELDQEIIAMLGW